MQKKQAKETDMKAFFFDVETTGVNVYRDYIVEIALVERQGMEFREAPADGIRFSSLVRPPISSFPEATAIHGITPSMVVDAPVLSDVLGQIKGVVGDSCYMIAHNGEKFDRLIFSHEANRIGNAVPAQWLWVDTLIWARKFLPHLRSHSLASLADYYQIKIDSPTHRAEQDCDTLRMVCECMWGDLTIKQVHDILSSQSTIKYFPWGKHKGTPLHKIPRDYASWVVNKSEASSELKEAVIKTVFKIT